MYTHVYLSEIRRIRTKKTRQDKHNPSSEHRILSEEKEKIRTEDSIQQESMHILHVDDDASFLKVSKMILELKDKFEIDSATSVEEAFHKLETQTYDAIICDYDISTKNGLDFLKELREQRNNIAFIIFTGMGTEEIVIRAINLGADYYIDKYGSPEEVYLELANAVRKTVERKKKARSIRGESPAS